MLRLIEAVREIFHNILGLFLKLFALIIDHSQLFQIGQLVFSFLRKDINLIQVAKVVHLIFFDTSLILLIDMYVERIY